jgi:hypothetical protein
MLLALLISAGVLVVNLLCYGVAMAVIERVTLPFLRAGNSGLGYWKNIAVMMLVSLITAVSHGVQISIWAVVLLLIGEMSTFDAAIYCSAQNYTALGYGDASLSPGWRLLGPLEAINGLLSFGVSTAVMFAVMDRLIRNRLAARLGEAPADKP